MPTIGDMYTKDVEVFGAPRHIEIDDTAGQEAYADLKKEKMSTGDVSCARRRLPMSRRRPAACPSITPARHQPPLSRLLRCDRRAGLRARVQHH